MHLRPNTSYDIELRLRSDEGTKAVTTARTWRNEFPIGSTEYQPEHATRTLTITKSGKPSAYVLYAPQPGKDAVIDGSTSGPTTSDDPHPHLANIVVDASYVVIRGLTLRNSGRHGIYLGPNAHHVVIEENDISGWGRVATDKTDANPTWGEEADSGIYADGHPEWYKRQADGTAEDIRPVRSYVIQRNRIHDPRSDANAWDEQRTGAWPGGARLCGSLPCHPFGPQGVTLQDSANSVIRYNEVYATNGHKFNDAVGGGGSGNFSQFGFPNRDSDIYGNVIADAWDDGIEAEGGNANVRIWSNYLTRNYNMVAVAATQHGPIYIFRNISAESQKCADVDGQNRCRKLGNELSAGAFLKTQSRVAYGNYCFTGLPKGCQGGKRYWGDGRIEVYHNTMHQPTLGGVKEGLSDLRGGRMSNVVSRNNLLQLRYAAYDAAANFRASILDSCSLPNGQSGRDMCRAGAGVPNSFDYDLFNGVVDVGGRHEQAGIAAVPVYWSGNGAGAYPELYLDPKKSPGLDDACSLPGFNGDFAGKGPDRGAYEIGVDADGNAVRKRFVQYGLGAESIAHAPSSVEGSCAIP